MCGPFTLLNRIVKLKNKLTKNSEIGRFSSRGDTAKSNKKETKDI
jgi:hypothetical protein